MDFLFGLVVGIVIGLAVTRTLKARGGGETNAERSAERDARVAQVLAAVGERGTITNDEVQALLGVSDASAERYLSELEAAGKIAQVGTVGKTVSYKRL